MNPAPGKTLRAVLDTNLRVSIFTHPAGRSAGIWQAGIEGRFSPIVWPPLVAEFARVWRGRFQWEEQKVRRTIRYIIKNAQIVIPRTPLKVVAADPADDRVVECAAAGQADLIVSNRMTITFSI